MKNHEDNLKENQGKKFEQGEVRGGERQLHNAESPALADSDRWAKTEELDSTSADRSLIESDNQQNKSREKETDRE